MCAPSKVRIMVEVLTPGPVCLVIGLLLGIAPAYLLSHWLAACLITFGYFITVVRAVQEADSFLNLIAAGFGTFCLGLALLYGGSNFALYAPIIAVGVGMIILHICIKVWVDSKM